MAGNFRKSRKRLAPRWLTEGEGELVGYSLDVVKDAFIERLRLGFLARLPENGPNGETAPVDALEAMGRDRGLKRGLSNTDAEYAERLKNWLNVWKTAGNPYTLMGQLAAYLGPLPSFRTVDVRGNWYSRDADGTESAILDEGNWDWDGADLARWSRFWVVIYPNGLWTSVDDWADTDLDWAEADHTWGTTATNEHVAGVKSIIQDWKPAGTRCVDIIIALDSASFDPSTPEPDGTYGRWSKTVDGIRVASRLSTARYWGGT